MAGGYNRQRLFSDTHRTELLFHALRTAQNLVVIIPNHTEP